MLSLGKEDFPGACRELFGEGFESRLKFRIETASTVAQAKKAGAPFFRGTAPRRFQGRFRGGRAQPRPSFFNRMRGCQNSFNRFRGPGRVLRFSSPPASSCQDSDGSKAKSSTYRYVLQSFEFFQSSNCKLFKFFSTHMALNNLGPLGPSGSSRLPNSIYLQSSSGTSFCNGLRLTRESVINRSGGTRTTCKTTSSLCSNQHAKRKRVHQFPLHSPQKGWGLQASNQSKTPKQLHSINAHVKVSSKEGRLLSKSTPKGCSFNGTYLGKTPKIPLVPMLRLPPGVSLPTVWPSKRPMSVNKTTEASVVSPKAEGHSACSLPRQVS